MIMAIPRRGIKRPILRDATLRQKKDLANYLRGHRRLLQQQLTFGIEKGEPVLLDMYPGHPSALGAYENRQFRLLTRWLTSRGYPWKLVKLRGSQNYTIIAYPAGDNQ
jgi:hypothetical protein